MSDIKFKYVCVVTAANLSTLLEVTKGYVSDVEVKQISDGDSSMIAVMPITPENQKRRKKAKKTIRRVISKTAAASHGGAEGVIMRCFTEERRVVHIDFFRKELALANFSRNTAYPTLTKLVKDGKLVKLNSGNFSKP